MHRQRRRAEREELSRKFVHNSAEKSAKDKIDLAISRIKRLMEPILDVQDEPPFPLEFVSSTAHDAVVAGLRRLAHNPGAQTQIPWLPWGGKSRTLGSVTKLLKSLVVPRWALDLKEQVLSSISAPTTEGMILESGKVNKDLEQLLANSGEPDLSGIEHHYDRAMTRLVREFHEFHGGLVTLRFMPKEEFRSVMSKALKESSPGYPFNGLDWDEDRGGHTVFDEVYNLGVNRINDADDSPFLFIQGARHTGDGQSVNESDSQGKQRLVMQAPANEKLLGHIIAHPLKSFFKLCPSSGQRGIQSVSQALKDLAQGRRKGWHSDNPIVAWTSADISQWDTAQTDEFSSIGFFEFLQRICNSDDEMTQAILRNYRAGYEGRRLWTAAGFVKPNMLPSGSSITTMLAFVHHTLILYVVDSICAERYGCPLFVEFGLQGDDQVAALTRWDDDVKNIIIDVYRRFNCRVKGDLRVRLQDDDPTVVFLNECIYLRDHSVDNVKFPRWNFFFAENFSDLVRGVNVDRLLMEEIRTRCAHPSPRELLVASYLSKMDRFYGLPFYERLLSWTVAQCEFPLRSWLGLRVMPDSLTLKALSELETRSGIEEPDSIRQDIDRQVDVWLAGEELGYAAGLLLLASECSHSKPIVRQVIKHARAQNRSWRRAGRAASQSDFSDPSIKSFTQTLISAFDDGYSRAAQELEQQRNQMTLASSEPDMVPDDYAPPAVADTEPVVRTTLAKAVLAHNDADPFGLAHKVAKAAIALRNSPNWSKLTDEQRAYANRAFEALFNTQLCSKDEPVA